MENRHLTVDIHTHILPKDIPNFKEKFGYGGFIHLDHHKPCCARMMMDDHFFREVEDNSYDAESRIKECNEQAVDVQVLSTVPVMFSYWAKPKDTLEVAMFLNDHIAGIVTDYSKRFIDFVDMRFEGTLLDGKLIHYFFIRFSGNDQV